MASSIAAQAIDTTPDEFPSSMAVAIRTAPTIELQSPADIQKVMLQLDEQQFLAEIMGEALEKWFYSFKVGGKEVEGVSAKGAHEFARLRAEQGFPIRFPMEGIRYEEASEMGEVGVRATVIARDYRTHAEAIGIAFYPYMAERYIRDRSGKVIETVKEFDRMAGRKAMSVAERNAILRLVPDKTVLSALKVRARIIAENEVQREAQARLACERRPEAPRVLAGTQQAADPYTEQPVIAAVPPCPACGGAMWDNRAKNEERKKEGKKALPELKCKDAKCDTVIWDAKNIAVAAGGDGSCADRRCGDRAGALADEDDDLPF